MNLTELVVTQKNVDELSAKFGLSEEQTLEAMAAVIPAFSEGLQRNTRSPDGASALIKALASGRHAQYAQDPATAVSAFGINDGNAILGHLFGNKDVSRAVASQASHATGIGSTVLKSLLPSIASMVMGALFKGATGSRSGGGIGRTLGQAAGGGLLGTIIEGVAGGMLGGAKQSMPRSRRTRSRRSRQTGGSLEDILGQVLGGGSTQRRNPAPLPRSRRTPSRRQQRRQAPTGGIEDILGQILGGGSKRSSGRTRTTPMPRTNTQRRQRRQGGGIGDIFGDMLQPGGNTSRDYQRQTGSVFDEFLGN